jgi:single-stranded DNA-binding protein
VIDALIAGRLFGTPAERQSKAGKAYATAKVRVAVREGESVFVNVIAFAPPAVTALLALAEGAGVALAGELTPGVWTDKDGKARPSLDLVAHQVLTEYHIARRRKVIRGDSPEIELLAKPADAAPEQPGGETSGGNAIPAATHSAPARDESDDVPF